MCSACASVRVPTATRSSTSTAISNKSNGINQNQFIMPVSSSQLTMHRKAKVSSAMDVKFVASNQLESQLSSKDDNNAKPIEIIALRGTSDKCVGRGVTKKRKHPTHASTGEVITNEFKCHINSFDMLVDTHPKAYES
eukprot:233508_1